LLLLCSGSARAYEQRPNTFSLGLQLGGGVFYGQGDYRPEGSVEVVREESRYPYDAYDWGAGLAIRLRYSLDAGHAVGISMEDLRFSRVSGAASQVDLTTTGSDGNPYTIHEYRANQYQLNNYMVDYYLYLDAGKWPSLGRVGRRYKNSPYIVAGIGFHKPTLRTGEFDAASPDIGFVGDLGLGWEYFLRPPFAFDLSVRGYYLKTDGGSGVAGEMMLGFQYYLIR